MPPRLHVTAVTAGAMHAAASLSHMDSFCVLCAVCCVLGTLTCCVGPCGPSRCQATRVPVLVLVNSRRPPGSPGPPCLNKESPTTQPTTQPRCVKKLLRYCHCGIEALRQFQWAVWRRSCMGDRTQPQSSKPPHHERGAADRYREDRQGWSGAARGMVADAAQPRHVPVGGLRCSHRPPCGVYHPETCLASSPCNRSTGECVEAEFWGWCTSAITGRPPIADGCECWSTSDG